MAELTGYIEGIGLLGPGLSGWSESAAILTGTRPYCAQPTQLPSADGLPPAERRRLGRVVKLAIAVGLQATSAADSDPSTLPAVFSSSGGDGHNCHEICLTLAAQERQLSPTRFHNSVHNAAAGYWSIATGCKAPSTVLCAFDASFAAGLIEALTQVVVDRTRVLLVAYDAQYPPPLLMKRPIPDAFGVAFVLAAHNSASARARVTAHLSDTAITPMQHPQLELLRRSIPAARSLPLLGCLASGNTGNVALEYLGHGQLAVDLAPCG
jgi:hypothetical protein